MANKKLLFSEIEAAFKSYLTAVNELQRLITTPEPIKPEPPLIFETQADYDAFFTQVETAAKAINDRAGEIALMEESTNLYKRKIEEALPVGVWIVAKVNNKKYYLSLPGEPTAPGFRQLHYQETKPKARPGQPDPAPAKVAARSGQIPGIK